MINKLQLVFQNNGFHIVFNSDNLKLLKRNNNEKFEYFIIVEVDSLDDIVKEKQLKYLNILKENIKDKEVDKNSTLLICLKSELLPLESNIYRRILEIEEDPYYFRKLVLPYTLKQLELIEGISDFGKIIKNPLLFDEFKIACKNKDLSESKYEIISQLYIKLPFLKLPVVTQSKNLVIDEYKELLNEDEKKVLNFITTIDVDNIIDNEDFFKIIKEL